MKKKILAATFAAGCAVACAFGLAACGGGGDNGGGGDDGEKRLTSVVLVDNGGTEYVDYEMGSFYYGSDEQPDLDALRLKATYSDNTTEWLDKNGDTISVTYRYNGEDLFTLPQPYEVGNYSVAYYHTYNTQSLGACLTFEIKPSVTASPYTLSVEKTFWKYLEEPTAVTVTKEGTPLEESEYGHPYCIAKDKFNEIKGAEDFKDKLTENSVYLTEEVKPGSYYLFVYINGESNAISSFKEVLIQKGDVTLANAGDCSGYYNYTTGGAIGKVNLSEVNITVPVSVSWSNAKGNYVSGGFEWVTPDDKVDSSDNGTTKKLKFVPEMDEYYKECEVSEPITLNIEKGYVDRPGLDGGEWDYWNGQDQEIKLYLSSSYLWEHFKSHVTIMHALSEVELGENLVLGTKSEIGTYRYTFELKDAVNYYWLDSGNPDNKSDVSPKHLDYEITARDSYITLYNYESNHTIDENLQVKIQIKPGSVTTSDQYNATPYVAGTLQAEILETYVIDEYSSYESTIDATVEVVYEDGYDWIVVTVKEFKDTENLLFGSLLIRLTAEGTDHYADINRVERELSIWKYEYDNVTCPITADETIEKPIGTTVGELYEEYELDTKLGKWVLYIKYTSTSDWSEVTDMDLALPEGEYNFKAVYESGFVQYANEIEEVEFIVKGI